jgi:hypothetical protein
MDETVKNEILQMQKDVVDIIEGKTGARFEEFAKEQENRMKEMQEALQTAQRAPEVMDKRKELGDMLHYAIKGVYMNKKAVDLAKADGRDDVVKSMQLQNFTDGGALAIPSFANEVWD